MSNFEIFFFLSVLTCTIIACDGITHENFSTKTTYDAWFSPAEQRDRDRELSFPDTCQPVFVDGTLRHGIRNPGKKDTIRINDFHAKLLKETDIGKSNEHIVSWSNKFCVTTEKHITETGRNEHINIAQRLGLKLKTLLQELDASKVTFLSSETNRTIESCNAFQTGLSNIGYVLKQKCVIDNFALRFFDNCKQYLAMKEAGVLGKEYNIFKETSFFRNMISAFKQRNSIPEGFEITPGQMKSVYVTAASEIAAFGNSVWIDLFIDQEIQALEYLSDLRSYWKRSYGFPINYEMSCVVLKDVFERMDRVLHNHPNQRKAIFRFAHAETLLPLISVLGLFKDDKVLLGTNYHENSDRAFRTSRMVPFSANLVFILLDCSGNDGGGSEESSQGVKSEEHYHVQVLFNELPIRLPFCESDVCPLSVLKHHLKKPIEQCDFDSMCALSHEHDEL